MAWSFPGGKEIFSVDEMIAEFTLESIQTTAPIFDTEKLRWMNGEYLRMKSDEELTRLIIDFVSSRPTSRDPSENTGFRVKPGMTLDALLPKILPLIKDRMKLLSEFESLAGFFFAAPKEFERLLKKDIVVIVQDALQSGEWNHDAMEQAIRAAADKAGLKAKDVFMELRLAITGKTVGPPLLESLEVLGKEETMKRLGQ